MPIKPYFPPVSNKLFDISAFVRVAVFSSALFLKNGCWKLLCYSVLKLTVSIRFLSPLKCFFQLSIMFILFKPGTTRSFISLVPKYFL